MAQQLLQGTWQRSPLHFNPLRPSRSHRAAVSWCDTPAAATASSPFAYVHQPYVGGDNEPVVVDADDGRYNPVTQRWESPEPAQMGVATTTRTTQTQSPPTARPDESPDYDWNYVVDDACF